MDRRGVEIDDPVLDSEAKITELEKTVEYKQELIEFIERENDGIRDENQRLKRTIADYDEMLDKIKEVLK